MIPTASTTRDRELVRILWRQRLLATPEGLAWLVANARRKEHELGPPENRPRTWLVQP